MVGSCTVALKPSCDFAFCSNTWYLTELIPTSCLRFISLIKMFAKKSFTTSKKFKFESNDHMTNNLENLANKRKTQCRSPINGKRWSVLNAREVIWPSKSVQWATEGKTCKKLINVISCLMCSFVSDHSYYSLKSIDIIKLSRTHAGLTDQAHQPVLYLNRKCNAVRCV